MDGTACYFTYVLTTVQAKINQYTHTYTYIYICVCVCVCVCTSLLGAAGRCGGRVAGTPPPCFVVCVISGVLCLCFFERSFDGWAGDVCDRCACLFVASIIRFMGAHLLRRIGGGPRLAGLDPRLLLRQRHGLEQALFFLFFGFVW